VGYIEVLKNICIHHLYNLSIINAINLDDNFTQKLGFDLLGHVRVHVFNRLISDELTKSLGIKTENMLSKSCCPIGQYV
jgi:hypothetical protein